MAASAELAQYATAAFALISAITASAAAIAAWRSAGAANEANDKMDRAHRSEVFRSASLLANRVISTTIRVDDLGNELKREYETLFTFAGQSSGSRKKLYVDEVEKKQESIRPMQNEAKRFLDGLAGPEDIDVSGLVKSIAEFEGNLAQLERVKEKFVFDIENVRSDNRLYRQNVISG